MEYPHERALVKQYESRPFMILGVNSDASAQTARKAQEDESLNWPSFFDGGSAHGPIARQWQVSMWPHSVLIDHDGTVRARGLSGAALDSAIAQLVSRAEANKQQKGDR